MTLRGSQSELALNKAELWSLSESMLAELLSSSFLQILNDIELPSDRLVKKAFTHASSLWWQKLSLWLSQHRFEGVLTEGTFSLVNAEQHLRALARQVVP